MSKKDLKRSQDNGIAIVNLENPITTENAELKNISHIRNNFEKNDVNKDSTMKQLDGWILSRILKKTKARQRK